MTGRRPLRLRWVLLGVAVLQLAWICALPPFAGVDEFDHGYRSWAVAHGQWVSEPASATRGTGALVSVSSDLVAAARPECEVLPYTGPEDCRGTVVGDRVEIASGAGRYNPVFYAVAGLPTLVVDGTTALYAMRAVTALWCLLLLGLALAALRAAVGPWAVLGAVVGISPVVVYSSSVLAPNGVEILAGLGFWAALVGLARDPARSGRYLVLGVVAGSLLVTLRSLGPLWAALVLVVALVALDRLGPTLVGLLRRPVGWVAAAVGVTAGLGSMLWILGQRSLVIGMVEQPETITWVDRVTTALGAVPLWILQTVAAFPSRRDPAPLFVYPCYLVVLTVFLWWALRWSRGTRLRRAVIATVVLGYAIPVGITVATVDKFGVSWQGRYAFPFLIGAAVLAGVIWADRGPTPSWRVRGPALGLLVVAHCAGPVAVLLAEMRVSPLDGSDAWALQPPVWLLLALTLVGSTMMVLSPIAAVGASAAVATEEAEA